MFVQIRKDLRDCKFSTEDGVNVSNDVIYPAKYVGDDMQIFISDGYRNVEGIDFDIIDG